MWRKKDKSLFLIKKEMKNKWKIFLGSIRWAQEEAHIRPLLAARSGRRSDPMVRTISTRPNCVHFRAAFKPLSVGGRALFLVASLSIPASDLLGEDGDARRSRRKHFERRTPGNPRRDAIETPVIAAVEVRIFNLQVLAFIYFTPFFFTLVTRLVDF